MIPAILLGLSLLFNPGPHTECHPWPRDGTPVTGSCQVVAAATPDWFRVYTGAAGTDRGLISVGIQGRGQADPCTLRELTTVHYHFPGRAFKCAYRLGEFQQILWRFEARLEAYRGPPECSALPTAYITADTALSWPNGAWYLLGTLIYLAPDAWHPAQTLFWADVPRSDGVRRVLIRSAPQLRGGAWHSFAFDLKALYRQWFMPPPGYTWADAVVSMAEVYAATRGADLAFSSRNHDVVGIPSPCERSGDFSTRESEEPKSLLPLPSEWK